MPGDVYNDLAAVARSRGVDVSAILNWVLAGARPGLVAEHAGHEKALAEAIADRDQSGPSAERLRVLHDLLGKLQGEYAALSNQVFGKEGIACRI